MIGDDSLGLVAASREPTDRRAGGGRGTRGANEWVIVEPGQALAAAGQERKTLLAHISSSPSLSFSRSRRSFIFIRRRLFSALVSSFPPIFSAPSRYPTPLSASLSLNVLRRWHHSPSFISDLFNDSYNWRLRKPQRKVHESPLALFIF